MQVRLIPRVDMDILAPLSFDCCRGPSVWHPGDVVGGKPDQDQSARPQLFPHPPPPTTASELSSSQPSAIDLPLQRRSEPPTCALWLTTRLQHPGPQARGVVVAAAAAEGLLPQAEPTINRALATVQGEAPSLVGVEEEALVDATSNRAPRALRNPRHSYSRTPR